MQCKMLYGCKDDIVDLTLAFGCINGYIWGQIWRVDIKSLYNCEDEKLTQWKNMDKLVVTDKTQS